MWVLIHVSEGRNMDYDEAEGRLALVDINSLLASRLNPDSTFRNPAELFLQHILAKMPGYELRVLEERIAAIEEKVGIEGAKTLAQAADEEAERAKNAAAQEYKAKYAPRAIWRSVISVSKCLSNTPFRPRDSELTVVGFTANLCSRACLRRQSSFSAIPLTTNPRGRRSNIWTICSGRE